MLIHTRYIPREGDAHLLHAGRRTYQKSRQTAASILRTARKEAKQRLQSAAEAGRTEGYSTGFSAGFKEGQKNAQREALEFHTALSDAIESARDDCVSLLFELAREIFGGLAEMDHRSVCKKVEELLCGMIDARPLIVQASPEQSDRIRGDLETMPGDPNIHVESSEGVLPGNARVITPAGSIELDWLSHLNLLKEHYASRNTPS